MSAGSSGSGSGFDGAGAARSPSGLGPRARAPGVAGGGGARDRGAPSASSLFSLSSAGGSILITDSMNVFQIPAGKVPPATGSPLNSVSIGISLLG